jgi:hypothetical protein
MNTEIQTGISIIKQERHFPGVIFLSQEDLETIGHSSINYLSKIISRKK